MQSDCSEVRYKRVVPQLDTKSNQERHDNSKIPKEKRKPEIPYYYTKVDTESPEVWGTYGGVTFLLL